MPFYEERNPDEVFRLGDIVVGFSIGTVNLPTRESDRFSIEVDKPKAVVMTPTCSIGDQTIVLASLKTVNPRWLETPYLRADLTNINRPMTQLQGMRPGRLESMDEDERAEIEADTREELQFFASFVYAPHDLLPQYNLKVKKKDFVVGHYCVDFREMHRIKCREIQSAQSAPLAAKILQLSLTSREKLRTKLVNYFGRTPQEDEPLRA